MSNQEKTDPSKNTMSWGEKFATWQAVSIITSILCIGVAWSLAATVQAESRSEKRDELMQSQINQFKTQQDNLNDTVVRMEANQENLLKIVDKIANKLNVQ